MIRLTDHLVRYFSSPPGQPLPHAPIVVPGGAAEFADTFTVEDVDRLLSVAGVRPPFLILFNSETGLTSGDYRLYHDCAVHCVSAVRVLESLIQHRSTLIIQHAHTLSAPLRALVQYLGHALIPLSVQSNCYLTPAFSQGVRPHADHHHTVLLQLSGKKRWRVWGSVGDDPDQPMIPRYDDPSFADAIAGGTEPLIDSWVNSGDCLIIPRGYVHAAVTSDSHSLHLTLGISNPGAQTAAELVYRRIAGTYRLSELIEDQSKHALNEASVEGYYPIPDAVEVI